MKATTRELALVALLAIGASGFIADAASGGPAPPRPSKPPPLKRISTTPQPKPTAQVQRSLSVLIDNRNNSAVGGVSLGTRQMAPSRASQTGRRRTPAYGGANGYFAKAPDPRPGRSPISSSGLSGLRDSYSPTSHSDDQAHTAEAALSRLSAVSPPPKPSSQPARRRLLSTTNPFATQGKYLQFGLKKEILGRYLGEDIQPGKVGVPTTTRYLDDEQRAAYQLTCRADKDGIKLYDASGKPFETKGAVVEQGGQRFTVDRAIFVMDAKGRLFASKRQVVGKFHHSSLAGGHPVAAAGEIVVHDGVVVSVNNVSGHYQPEATYLRQLALELRTQGIDLRKVEFKEVKGVDPITKEPDLVRIENP